MRNKKIIEAVLIQRCATDGQNNIEESIALAKNAAGMYKDLDLIIFPEYNAGFSSNLQRAHQMAEGFDGPYLGAMKKLAGELACYIDTGSFYQIAGEKIKNTVGLIDRNGQLCAHYSKIHLADTMGFQESDYVEAGDEICLAETDFGKVGISVCYDLRFPELYRTQMLAGADLFLVSALWPCGNPLPPRTDHWDILTKAAALQNLTYTIACNQYGNAGSELPFGNSRVIDPWGQVIAQAGEGTRIVHAQIDLEYQKKVREKLASLANRRPDLY